MDLKQEDPKALQKEIDRLKAKLQSRKPPVDEAFVTALIEANQTLTTKLREIAKSASYAAAQAEAQMQGFARIAGASPEPSVNIIPTLALKTKLNGAVDRQQMDAKVGASHGAAVMPKNGRRRMLIALAQCPNPAAGLTANGLAMRSGLSPNSGTFGTYLSGWRRPSPGQVRELLETEARRLA